MKKIVLSTLILSFLGSPLLASDKRERETEPEERVATKKANTEIQQEASLVPVAVVQDSDLLRFPNDLIRIIINHVDAAKDQYHLALSCRRMRELVNSFPYAPCKFNDFMFALCEEGKPSHPRTSMRAFGDFFTEHGAPSFIDIAHVLSETQKVAHPRARDRFVRDFFLDTVAGRQDFIETYEDFSYALKIFKGSIGSNISEFKILLLQFLQEEENLTELNLPLLLIEDGRPICRYNPNHIINEIGRFRKLQKLTCPYRIKALSPAICTLRELTDLDLGLNLNLCALPASFGNLQALHTLNLKGNSLTRLPQSFRNLRQLRHLDLSNNLFECFPEALLAMPDLQTLNLSNFDMSFGEMTALNNYDQAYVAKKNKLREIPCEIASMTSLQSLNLSGNPLTEIPGEIALLSALRRLDISRTKITDLPRAVIKREDLEVYTPEERNKRHREVILRLNPELPELSAEDINNYNWGLED